MLSALLIVVPIPLLIATGWLARHIDLLGPQAAAGIDRFLVLFALPAFLFNIIAHASSTDLWQPDFIVVLLLSSAASMSLALCVYLSWADGLADATVKGVSGSFMNIRYVGLPFLLIAPDSEVLVPATIGFLLTTGVMLVFAILLMEVGLRRKARRYVRAREIGQTLICNPVIVTCVIAVLFPVFGLTLPPSADVGLALLGGAATPCALIALGAFLAGNRFAWAPNYGGTALLVCWKMLLHPLLAWVFARFIFQLPFPATRYIVVLAALPAGTGSVILADLYGRRVEIPSQIVLLSTLGSVVTLVMCIDAIR